MRESDIMIASTSALRKRIMLCNKAILGAKSHPNGLVRLTLEDIDHELTLIRRELNSRRSGPKIIHLRDICIDCDGSGVYPSGSPCKSCRGTGRVERGDGIPPDGTSSLSPADGKST